jgi:hypothetical protein
VQRAPGQGQTATCARPGPVRAACARPGPVRAALGFAAACPGGRQESEFFLNFSIYIRETLLD